MLWPKRQGYAHTTLLYCRLWCALQKSIPFQQHPKLPNLDLAGGLLAAGPGEAVTLQAFLPHAEPIAVPVQRLQQSSVLVAEQIQVPRQRIRLHRGLHQRGQAVDLFRRSVAPRTHKYPEVVPINEHGPPPPRHAAPGAAVLRLTSADSSIRALRPPEYGSRAPLLSGRKHAGTSTMGISESGWFRNRLIHRRNDSRLSLFSFPPSALGFAALPPCSDQQAPF